MDNTPPDGVRLGAPSVSVLFVDDDPLCGRAVTRELRRMGYRADACTSFQDLLQRGAWNRYDVILLDVRLGSENGIDVCRAIRRDGFRGCVIMLSGETAKKTIADALDSGADDYVTKPYDPRELRARIEAVRRRSARPGAPPFVVSNDQVFVGGVPTRLSPPQLEFLLRLHRANGAAVPKTEFFGLVDPPDHDKSGAVDELADRVRRKLGNQGWRIGCTKRVGYFLVL